MEDIYSQIKGVTEDQALDLLLFIGFGKMSIKYLFGRCCRARCWKKAEFVETQNWGYQGIVAFGTSKLVFHYCDAHKTEHSHPK
jgi:hypothetical protein